MKWNHRVVQFDREKEPPLFALLEVYYHADGRPHSYCDPFMCGDSIGDLRQLVNRLGDAINNQIINAKDMVHADPHACALCGERKDDAGTR